jgi:2-polyprenyl-3-methyl-5-hydroxy-6-metoxy-1,4-benzoquinol methylase
MPPLTENTNVDTSSLLQYETQQIELQIGNEKFKIECVRDLNKTIDDLFAVLEKQGNPSLLEKLCPYFGVIWPSARGLAQHLSGLFPIKFEELKVLEVGCGLALPSLYCARKGAHVVATDFHPEVPRFLERNIALNGIKTLEFRHSNWAEDAQSQTGPVGPGTGKYDWVIGSDVLYESQHPKPVARALASQLRPDGKIMLADPARPYLQAFSDEMQELGFQEETKVIRVQAEAGAPVSHRDIFVLSFTRA